MKTPAAMRQEILKTPEIYNIRQVETLKAELLKTDKKKKIPVESSHKSADRGENNGRHTTNNRKNIKKLALIALVVFAIGIFVEVLCNLSLLRANSGKSHGSFTVDMSRVTYEGFHEEDGKLVFDGENGKIRVPLNGRFVGKFCYSYEYDGLLNATVKVGVYNDYGELRERDILTVTDRNSKNVKNSWIPVNRRAEYAEIYVFREALDEPGLSYIDFKAMPLHITGFEAVTIPAVNWYRLCFFWCLFGIGAMLIFYREYIGKRIEIGFLIISISVGTLLSLSLPANKVSWDEEVHFSQSFWMSNYRTPVSVSPAITQEFIAGIDTWPYNQPGTAEEQREFDNYLDLAGDYRNGGITWSADLNKTIFTGYAGEALLLKAGQLFHLPFSLVYKLGRLGNLFIYCIALYFAIKKTPVGKGIMVFLGLMPEPMMLAGVYSYDPTVTAFMYLSFAYILSAVLEPDKKITWKEYAVIMLAFFWGCRIKAVYAPLLLTGLLIPSDHFRSRREKLIMKGGMILLCLGLMASFALPVIFSPSETGDVRGDNTSEAGQMSYVLGQPVAYAKILIQNIFHTLPSYVIGEKSLGLLGHQGEVSFPWLVYAGSAAVILTGGQSSCGKRLDWKQKLWIFILASAAVVLVWTSMYVIFTTPGNTYIDGVQGRYYIPFLFLVWLVLNPKWVTVHLKNKDYYGLVLALSGGMLLAVYYINVLQKFCL